MGKFNRGDRSGARRFGDRRPDRPTTMFQATCSECGKACEVPFKPTGERPVLCSDCFAKKRNAEHGQGRSSGDRKMYVAVCHNCGRKCEVPFQPSSGKPVYCDECFGKTSGGGDRGANRSNRGGSGDLEKKLDALNNKLDQILEALTKAPAPKTSAAKKPAGKTTTKKAATKKKK